MKITFLRYGHSNNSSSSHSLIFTRQNLLPPSDESSEFGWQFFTCSSKRDKLNYLLTCLRSKFSHSLKMPYLGHLSDHSNKLWSHSLDQARASLENVERDLFNSWVKIYL